MGIKLPVDFSGTENRGSVRAPEGDYIVKIKKVEQTKAKSSGNPMLVMTFEFVSGPSDIKGKTIIDRHMLLKDSLWTLRNMLEAMGYKVPSGPMKLDSDKMLIGRKVGISVVDGDEYKGRIKSDVGDYIPVSAVDNKVTGDSDTLDEDDEGDDWDDLEDEDEPDDEDDDDPVQAMADEDEDDEDEEDESFAFDDDEEEDEDEEVELSFDASDVEEAKGAELKKYLKEAQAAGIEFDLGEKAKVAEVREALLGIFGDDEDEAEDFDLDDI